MIDGMQIVDLLGRSSVDDSLERVLLGFDLKNRPKGPDLDVSVDESARGLVLLFKALITYREEIGEPVSEGKYVFSGIHFSDAVPAEQTKRFDGILPFGLRFGMTQSQIIAHLSSPIRLADRPAYIVSTFRLNEAKVVTTKVEKKSEAGLVWARVEMIDKFHRERGDV